MSKLLVLPFFTLIFLGCDDASTEVDPLFYQISEADSARCMEEILDGILNDSIEIDRIRNNIYNPHYPNCGEIEVLLFSLNSQGELLINSKIDSTTVKQKTYEYFMFNRNLTWKETESTVLNPRSLGFHYPFYNLFEHQGILEKIEETQSEVDQIRHIAGADPLLIEYYESKVEEWKVLKQAIEQINSPELPQINPSAHVRFEFQKPSMKDKEILNEIGMAFYQMRNYECLLYFNESYLSLYERAQRRKRTIDLEKLDALKTLHPASIYAVDIADKNAWCGVQPVPVLIPQ